MTTLAQIIGSTIVDNHGKEYSTDSLKGKYVGLYFSADWCPACHQFTPLLKAAYPTLQTKNLEIVYVSADRAEPAFTKYFGTMPWKAVPFSHNKERAQASEHYKIEGYPTLVIADEHGNVITPEGVEEVMGDKEAKGFPWRVKSYAEAVGNVFIDHKDNKFTYDDIKSKADYLGVYFSASWCGPCRAFTPELIKTYQQMKSQGKRFEIVFASKDKSAAEFAEYYGKMPWLALPFGSQNIADLAKLVKQRGIPCLAIFDTKTGELVNKNARMAIADDEDGEDFPWAPKEYAMLSPYTAQNVERVPCLLYFMADNASKQDVSAAKTTISTLPTDFEPKFNAARKGCLFMLATPKNKEISASLKDFLKITQTGACAALVDLQSLEYSLTTDVSAQSIKTLVESWLAGKATMTAVQLPEDQ